MRRLLLVALLVALGLAGWSAVAAAHAVLVAADPADGTTVDGAPEQVVLEFSEPVSLELGGVEVLDAAGVAVQEGDGRADGATVTVDLPGELEDGTYVVSYRVLSADGHPVSGAVLFGVGVSPDAGAASGTGTAADAQGWGVWAGAGRWMSYVGALLASGAAVFLTLVADSGVPRRPFRWLVPVAATGTLLALPLLVVSQAARATGLGWDVLSSPDTLRTSLGQGLGQQCVLLVIAIGLALVAVSTKGAGSKGAAVASVVSTAAAFASWGHVTAADPRWLATTGDVLHVAAGSLWFGGTVVLSWLLIGRIGPAEAAARTVARFSVLATGIVVAVAIGGTALAAVELGAVDGLWSSTYGRLILVKVVLVASVVALGAWNRFRLVPEIAGGGPDRESVGEGVDPDDPVPLDTSGDREPEPAWRRLRRSVAAEAVLLLVVISVTAVLVEVTPPANDGGADAVAGGPFEAQAAVGDATLYFEVTPGVAGANEIHLTYLGADGALSDLAQSIELELRLPSADLGPIAREPTPVTAGHAIYSGNDLSIAGTWEITVVTRLSRFEEERNTFAVPIG